MKIENFEDIKSWQHARRVTNKIYDLSDSGRFNYDFALKNQIRKSSLSILSNIAEGFERNGNREFINFLYIAKGSCGEARAQLYIALDRRYVSKEEFETVHSELTRISGLLSGFIKYLKGSEMKGSKFRN